MCLFLFSYLSSINAEAKEETTAVTEDAKPLDNDEEESDTSGLERIRGWTFFSHTHKT